MRQHSDNPGGNRLPEGIGEECLISTIQSSGYPLQGVVASKLDGLFVVTEEWGYIDRDSKQHRSLDVVAYKQLEANETDAVKPCLALLVECKRSKHPYIFFKDVIERRLLHFPATCGLHNNRITIYEESKKRSQFVPAARLLGIDKLPFTEGGPPKCSAFSKAIPRGKKVELSGDDPFNSLVLPLTRALDHAVGVFQGNVDPKRPYPTLLLCVSVIDAPMILVDSPTSASELTLCPWVRIVRQEANANSSSRDRYQYYAIDVVHIDFFEEFLHENLLPFADTFCERARQRQEVLLDGGVVDSLDDWEWDTIRPRTK